MVWCEENRYLFGLAKNDRPSADIKLELAMNAGRFDWARRALSVVVTIQSWVDEITWSN